MPTFRKAILKVGSYRSPDGAVEVTPERLKHWASTHSVMRSRQLGVPVGWDHSDKPEETIPVAFSTVAGKKTAKNAAGWLKAFDLAADGQSAVITLDIPGTDDAAKVENNVVEVSPIIYPEWADGQGRKYTDCITHVDLVHHPVDASQSKFEKVPDAIACGIRMGLNMTPYRMADDDFPPKKKDGEGDDSGDSKSDDSDADKGDGMLGGDKGGDDKSAALAAVVEKLVTELDVHFPEGVDHESTEGITLLLTAILNRVAGDKKSDEEEDDMAGKDDKSGVAPVQPDITTMSLQVRTALQYAEGQHRLSLNSRLDKLCAEGRCTPAEMKQYGEIAGAVRLSLDSTGKPELSDVDKFIASREPLPFGAMWPAGDSRLRMANAVPQPGHVAAGDQPTEADDQATADWAMGKGKKPVTAA